MAHHGYERPGFGWQTASCAAARSFRPLEVSSEGLAWLLGLKRATQEQAQKHLAERPSWDSVVHGYPPKIRTIRRDEPGWAVAEQTTAGRLESDIRFRGKEIARLAEMLDAWTPKPWPPRKAPTRAATGPSA
jgi:hypothetical protein